MKVDELLYFIKPKTTKAHSLPKNLIINLTSYPKRYSILYLALRSLLNQSIIPDKVILWLWNKDYDTLPTNVRDLESQGLEIKLLKARAESILTFAKASKPFKSSLGLPGSA